MKGTLERLIEEEAIAVDLPLPGDNDEDLDEDEAEEDTMEESTRVAALLKLIEDLKQVHHLLLSLFLSFSYLKCWLNQTQWLLPDIVRIAVSIMIAFVLIANNCMLM